MSGRRQVRSAKGKSVSEDVIAKFKLPDEIPSGVNPALWGVLQQIERNTTFSTQRITDLETSVSDLVASNAALRRDVDAVQILTGKFQHAEIWNSHLQNELTEMKAHSMQDNFIFSLSGDKYNEAAGEKNCVEKIRYFLHSVMGLTPKDFLITTVHRMGQKTPGRSRQIIARLPVASQQQQIFTNLKRLRGTQHFVSRHLPPTIRETHQYAMEEYKERKKDGSKDKVVMAREKLYVNGELQVKYLPERLLEALDGTVVDIQAGGVVSDSGSKFSGFAAKIS